MAASLERWPKVVKIVDRTASPIYHQRHGQAGGFLEAHLHAQPGGMLGDAEAGADRGERIIVDALLGGP